MQLPCYHLGELGGELDFSEGLSMAELEPSLSKLVKKQIVTGLNNRWEEGKAQQLTFFIKRQKAARQNEEGILLLPRWSQRVLQRSVRCARRRQQGTHATAGGMMPQGVTHMGRTTSCRQQVREGAIERSPR